MNNQTILNMTTCQQVQEMMDTLEHLQSLCITHYEGLAMQEQQEITKLEQHINTTPHQEDITICTDDTRTVCKRCIKLMKKVSTTPNSVSLDTFEEHYFELDLMIEECKQLNLTSIVEYCELLSSRMTIIHEGMLMDN